MFATLPYTLAAASLGAKFEQRVHLTNYDINVRESNLDAYLKDKPGVGKGALWDAKKLEAWLRRTRPDLSYAAIMRQVRLVGRGVAQSIARHPNVSKMRRALPHGNEVGYELFGIDMMLDDAGKVWLLECNDSPGLEYCGAHLADGTPSPDAARGGSRPHARRFRPTPLYSQRRRRRSLRRCACSAPMPQLRPPPPRRPRATRRRAR